MSEVVQSASWTHLLRCVCTQCEKPFTGKYCQGNLKRHIRHKHATSLPDPRLQCEVCYEFFNRTDAKNIHRRRFHDDQSGSASIGLKRKRKREVRPNQPDPVDHDSRESRSWPGGAIPGDPIPSPILMQNPRSIVQPKIIPPKTEANARDLSSTVCALVGRLKVKYTRVNLKNIFDLFKAVRHELVQRPKSPVTLGLSTILSVLLDRFKNGSGRSQKSLELSRNSFGTCNQDSSTSNDHENDPTAMLGTVDLDTNLQLERFNPTTPTSKQHFPGPNKTRLFACPVRKHSDIYLQDCSCTFPGKPSMWGVKQHMRQRDHRSEYQYIAQCDKCWVYYQTNIYPNGCPNVHDFPETQRLHQPRGAKQVEQWFALYQTLYPGHEEPVDAFVDDLPPGLETLPSNPPRPTTSQQQTLSKSLPSNYPSLPVDPGFAYPIMRTNSGHLDDPQLGLQWPSAMNKAYELAALEALESILAPSESEMSDKGAEFVRRHINHPYSPTPDQIQAITNHFVWLTINFVSRAVQTQQQYDIIASSSNLPTTTFGQLVVAPPRLSLNMDANIPYFSGFEQPNGLESNHAFFGQGPPVNTFDFNASYDQTPHDWRQSQH